MNDRPVSETAHYTRQSIYGRAGLYGALAVASIAGVAVALARAGAAHVELVGRSPLPEGDEPADTAAASDLRALRAAVLARAAASLDRVADPQTELDQVLADLRRGQRTLRSRIAGGDRELSRHGHYARELAPVPGVRWSEVSPDVLEQALRTGRELVDIPPGDDPQATVVAVEADLGEHHPQAVVVAHATADSW